MKKQFFLLPLFAALVLTGCSSDDQLITDSGTSSEVPSGDSYVTVSIAMPTSIGTKAEGYFEDGTNNESTVDNAVFFFFDGNDLCVDVQKIDNPTFTMTSQVDPNIENIGTIELRLKSGLSYKQVAVALNSTAIDASSLKSDIKNVKDLENRFMDYASQIVQTTGPNKPDNVTTEVEKKKGQGQMMSNSVYYSSASEIQPTAPEKVCLVRITENNIYTSADRPTIKNILEDPNGEKKYVDIYVERVAARIDVRKTTFSMDNYYISEEGNTKKTTVTLYDHTTLTSKEIVIKPVITGMCLNVLTPTANLIKPIKITDVGYGVGSGDYKNFRWNDPTNKRSYWASTALHAGTALQYFSWDDAVDQGFAEFSQYINPNTQDFAPTIQNEGNSANTKIMVVAELHQYDETGKEDNGTIDLVRYGADYMLSSALLTHAANLVNVAVRNIDWANAGLTLNEIALTEEQLKQIKIAVNNAFVGETEDGFKGLTDAAFELKMLNPEKDNKPGEADWEATVAKVENFEDIINNLGINISDEALLDIAKKQVNKTINAAINSINEPAILYWKGGKTYFYHNIRHQGFYGLLGNGTSDFLYGVVRNHIYKIQLEGVFGLGTPVIEPGRPIDPDRPEDERPSFIQARINILKWRVVTNTAIAH